MLHNIGTTIKKRKGVVIFLVLVLIGGAYIVHARSGSKGETRYVLAAAEKGTLIRSVSGSGQIAAVNQVDIKSKVSGDVLRVFVVNGQEVTTGATILQLNAKDALKAVRDAEANLAAANLSLSKLKKPADELSTLQTEHALTDAQEAKAKAEDTLQKAYEDGFTAVSNAFLDLPTIMAGLDSMLFDSSVDTTQANIDWYANRVISWEETKVLSLKTQVKSGYDTARAHYNVAFEHFRAASRTSDTATTEALIAETYETSTLVGDAVKTTNNYIDFVKDILEQRNLTVPSLFATHTASLQTYTTETNAQLSSLLAIKHTIADSKEGSINADRTIAEKTEALAKLRKGTDPLDLQSQEITVQQRKNALLDAREKLADYSVRAAFDGVIAKIDAKTGDSISSGTALGTLITRGRIAQITLSEVDVAKVSVGQKVALTFDAIPDLSISGKVTEIDAVGTVVQGVVSYTVKIMFDTQDERVKPGMSVSAAIITDVKEHVLMVPNSAVKTQGGTSYVETVDNPIAGARGIQGVTSATPPARHSIEIGLANDTSTEIVSGLNEGDEVIIRTITPTTAAAVPQAPSLFGGGARAGGGGTGGGAFRQGR